MVGDGAVSEILVVHPVDTFTRVGKCAMAGDTNDARKYPMSYAQSPIDGS